MFFFWNRCLAERHFPESALTRTSFSRKRIERNEHHYKIETSISRIPNFTNSHRVHVQTCPNSNSITNYAYLRRNSQDVYAYQFDCHSSTSKLNKSIRGRSIRWNDVLFHTISAKWRSAKWCFGKKTFGWTTIRKNVVQLYEVSLIRRFGHVTIRSNYFRQFFFGKTTIRQNCISAERRFDKMTFRENHVAPHLTDKTNFGEVRDV